MDHHRRDVVRDSETQAAGAGQRGRLHVLGHGLQVVLGEHEAGGDGVGAYAFPAPARGDVAHQCVDAGLCHCVAGSHRFADEGRVRSRVHECPAAAPQHLRNCMTRAEQVSPQVHRHRALENAQIHVHRIGVVRDHVQICGVDVHEIQPAIADDGRLHEGRNGSLLGDVAVETLRLATCRRNLCRDCCGIAGIEIADDDPGARGGEATGGRSTDAAATRHDGHLATQRPHRSPRRATRLPTGRDPCTTAVPLTVPDRWVRVDRTPTAECGQASPRAMGEVS